MSTPIWFNRPAVTGNELRYIEQAIASGHLSGDGDFSKRCHARLAEISGAQKALLTTSCTHALEMAMLLVDLKPGDEVICPAFTFVSTANAVALRGARPVFVDVRADTLNLDERLVEAAITPRTRAVIVVHYAGVACEMDEISAVASRHGLRVIEDNAHGLFGKYKGRPLGSLGALSALSFHETKNLTCGEGGALLLNEPGLVDRAEIIREKGTNRSRFFRGHVDKYSWVDLGSSYLPSEILAAFLAAQLEARQQIQSERRRVWQYYQSHLQGWAAARGIRLPCVPGHCEQPYHMFYLLLPSLAERQRLIDHLKARSILSVFHYLPLHLSDMGRQYGGRPGQCPVTEEASDCLLRLPFYNDLSEHDQAFVVESLLSFDSQA
jgi:dTDP-4-amino-4,6-dideoxygalactose transaminase